ncbi:MAG: magnesium/cobalt transporter CorA [Bacteroidota bacterium]
MKKQKIVGLPPGAIVYTGDRALEKIFIHYMQYDEETIIEEDYNNHDDAVFQPLHENKVDWYDVRGIHDTRLIEEMGKVYTIHPLILEDISDIHQRPKFEEYERGIFIIVKALARQEGIGEVKTEQVAIYFREGMVVSFQEMESDLFEPVRRRLQAKSGRIRGRGADYLAYALIDVIVDHYHNILNGYEDQIETLEDRVMVEQKAVDKNKIHQLRKELGFIRKQIYPLREAMGKFSRTESALVIPNTIVFVRDLYDNMVHLMDTVDAYRELLNSVYELFLSEVSFRMNQVMQVLTIVSSIFIPMGFLAGVYGMNFEYIPELQNRNGYFIFWGVIATIFVGLLFYFRQKKWL